MATIAPPPVRGSLSVPFEKEVPPFATDKRRRHCEARGEGVDSGVEAFCRDPADPTTRGGARVPEKRRLWNDQVRRQVNLRIEAIGARWDGGEGVEFEFMCECDRPDCGEMLRLTVAQYARLRADDRYLVVPAHATARERRRVAAASDGIYAITHE